MNLSKRPQLIVITGPTASGKTDLSLRIAFWINQHKKELWNFSNNKERFFSKEFLKQSWVEIVNADSRQLYKGMDIGTAKPSQKEREKIPHHLFDICQINEGFSSAEYQQIAEKKINQILNKGRAVLLVGGSPFYIFSIIKGWQFPKVEPNWKLREDLEKKSPKKLFEILKSLDPERARTIERENKRRLIRAIEIAKNKGMVPRLKTEAKFDCLVLAISIEKTQLKQRIFKRVEKMIRQGLEGEVKKLAEKYGWSFSLLNSTIGYQEWKPYFEGKISKKEVVAQIKKNTWQFVRHQLLWFKREKDIHWIKSESTAYKLIKKWRDYSVLPWKSPPL